MSDRATWPSYLAFALLALALIAVVWHNQRARRRAARKAEAERDEPS
jgi:cbb3-type cytochrome oxidase subunit 3